MSQAPGVEDPGTSVGQADRAANPASKAEGKPSAQARTYRLNPEALSEATQRWVWLASQIGAHDPRVPRRDPPASFLAMLYAAQLVDDPDARWLAGQLGEAMAADLATHYGALDAQSLTREPVPAAAELLPKITGSVENRLHLATLAAFGHRPDARATPADLVAVLVDPRTQSGHTGDYAMLPLKPPELAAAFLDHVRAMHPELRFVFAHLLASQARVPIKDVESLISRFAPDVDACFCAAQLESTQPDEIPVRLVALLGQRLGIALTSGPSRAPAPPRTTPITELPLESAAWFESAHALAASADSDRIDLHHLVAVALRRGRNGDHLLTAAIDPTAISPAITQLIERVGATRGDEAEVIWSYFQTSAPVPPAPPTYHADTSEGRDRLNFEAEARAVALLAVSEAAPPLSIGVFGEWGTGKSFFLRRVRAHVEAEAKAKAKAQPETEAPTKPAEVDVLQIDFNAWHYAEGNLFASIAHRVFTALRERMGGQPTNPLDDALPATLRSETARMAARDAAENRSAAEDRLKTRQATIDQQRTGARDLVEAGLDVVPEARRQIDAARVMLRQQVRAGWKLARDKLLQPRAILPLAAGVILVAAVVIEWDALKTWYMRLAGFAVAATAWATAAGKHLMTAWRHAQTAWRHAQTARAHIQTLDRAMTDVKRRRDPELTRLAMELSAALMAESAANARAAAADSELAGLLARIKSGAPMERLDALVRDRFESGTYMKMLGIIEQVRSDLEMLSVLLVPDRDEKRRAELLAKHQIEASKLPKLRRIILYIDDLDRCPSHKVVEVLQAVHLLLAFPLFVVFVAIDPRWGIASLERSFEQLAPSPSGAITSATGFDYLEKIFQIPLWVRTMSGGDAARLLGDYFRPGAPPLAGSAGANGASAANPALVARPPTGNGAARTTVSGGDTPGAPATAAPTVSPSGNGRPAAAGSGAPAPSPAPPGDALDRVRVSLAELTYAEALATSLGSSPRRVKRFANLYQLVKAMLSGPEWHGFDLEDAYACLTLLAIQTGAPSVAPEVLDDLITGAHLESEKVAHLGLPALQAPRSPRGDAGDLARVKQILEIYFEHTTLGHSRSQLTLWAPRISRLAFRRDAVPGPRPPVATPHA